MLIGYKFAINLIVLIVSSENRTPLQAKYGQIGNCERFSEIENLEFDKSASRAAALELKLLRQSLQKLGSETKVQGSASGLFFLGFSIQTQNPGFWVENFRLWVLGWVL